MWSRESVSLLENKSMITSNTPRVTTALSVAVVIFLIALVAPKVVFPGTLPRLMTTQGLELLLALLAVFVLGKGKFSEYGFCKPRASQPPSGGSTRWVRICLTAPLLGMVASPLILGLGGTGNPLVKSLNFPQIVLFIWVLSSTIEEVFTRGFLQGHLSVLSGKYVKLLFLRVELPVLISALFFACMHFSLLLAGVDATTMVVTFFFTFSIGLMAGYLRARTGSIIPAIAAHFGANVGGMIGGVIYALVSFMITGKLPGT
jgi:membrane protease YdiL (CAAX protease family)